MNTQALRNEILLQALTLCPEQGWSLQTLQNAAQTLGHPPLMAEAVFSGGLAGATRQISQYFDTQTLAQLGQPLPHMRQPERISHAVMTRLDLMAPYKNGLRIALGKPRPKSLWQSADAIWSWAGDTATDYNRYTKRALLSGIMASTILFWFQDNSPGNRATHAFLERRLSNVLNFGRLINLAKSFFKQKAG